MNSDNHLSIKSWSEEDRPREKLQLQGKATLSNSELIAILLGSGSRNESAVSLAKRILQSVDNNLNALGKLEIEDLTKFKGMGPAKAITLIAALELGRRRKAEPTNNKTKISSSYDAYQCLAHRMADLKHEEMHILFLNQANEVIKQEQVSMGGVSNTIVDPKIIFKKAIQYLASVIIVAHNHPSGSLKPSNEDINITKKLVEGGKLLAIRMADHLIISDEGYFSFADENML